MADTVRKVIFIISFCTKEAEFENQPAPRFQWITKSGEMVGIWGLEWGDLMLKALVDNYPQYECEVWQPDLRADKPYTAQLQHRLIHTNYPADLRLVFQRYKFAKQIVFVDIQKIAAKYDQESTVFMIPTYVYYGWLCSVVSSLKKAKVLYYNFLHPRLMLPQKIATNNPFKALNYHLINKMKIRSLQRMDNLYSGYIEPDVQKELARYNPGTKVFRRIFGMDAEKWVRDKSQEQARLHLGIDDCSYVIVLSQRLVPEYQVDKFITALSRVKTHRRICCIITGHGSRDYEQYLSELVNEVHLENVVNFVGFVSDELLKDYLIAADIFATVARAFSGSGSAVKAMLLETPVLHVSISGTYQFLADYGAGIYVDPYEYDQWTETLQKLVDGLRVQTIDRDLAVKQYSWKNTALQLHTALNNLK